jgi:hypothetical protein
MSKSDNHFIIIDPLANPTLLKILKEYFSEDTTTIRLEGLPESSGGFVSFAPWVSETESFGGFLHVPSNEVLLFGSGSNNKLGFHCMSEAES